MRIVGGFSLVPMILRPLVLILSLFVWVLLRGLQVFGVFQAFR